MDKIIITGVDGNFGRRAANVALTKVPKEQLIFTAPRLEPVQDFIDQGIEVRLADYNDPAGLVKAFEGGKTILFISMPFVGERRRNAHKAAIDAAVAAGVENIVYTSIVGSGDDACESYEKFDHQYTEGLIFASGMHYKIMRNSQYVEAMVAAYSEAVNTTGILENNMGEGHMAHVSRDDCAEAAACAACGAGENDRIYYISGPTANTISEFIAMANEVTGYDVKYHFVTDEENFAFFDSKGVPRYTDGEWAEAAKNFPFCSAGMVTFGTAIRNEQMNFCTNDFEYLTGHKPLSVRDVFRDLEHHQIGARTSTDTYREEGVDECTKH